MTNRSFIFDDCKQAACVLLALLVAPLTVQAAEFRWLDPGTGSWFDTRNWDPAAVPGADDEVTIDIGGTARIASPGARARVIWINNGNFTTGGIDIVSPGSLIVDTANSGINFERGSFNVSGTDALLRLNEPGAGFATFIIGGGFDLSGTATVNVSGGARIESERVRVTGFGDTSSEPVDQVTVTGSGTEWQIDGGLEVGIIGAARLDVLDGAHLHTDTVNIAISDENQFAEPVDRISTITVSGAGSRLEATDSLCIGDDGSGAVRVANGATLKVGTAAEAKPIELACNSGGSGVLEIGGQFQTAGVIDALEIFSVRGASESNKVVFRHNDDFWFTDTGEAGGQPVAMIGVLSVAKGGGGTLRLSGVQNYLGSTTVNFGSLIVNSSLETSIVRVISGATFGGNGTITAPVTVESDAVLAPGDGGAGTLTTGDLELGGTAATRLELNEPAGSANDRVDVQGNLVLDGVFKVSPGPNFGPGQFTVMTYSGSVTDRGVPVQGLPSGLSATVTAGGGEVVLSVDGPALAVDPPGPLDFGDVEVGGSLAGLAAQLTNTGTTLLTIDSIAPPDNSAFAEIDRTCPAGSFTLNPGQSCRVEYAFTPPFLGHFTGFAAIDSNAALGPDRIELAGTGVQAVLDASPETVEFADTAVGETAAARSVTIKNIGTADLKLDTIAIQGSAADEFGLVNDTCSGGRFAPGVECTFGVTFTPSATGSRAAQVTIPSNAPTSPDSVTLSGTGTEPAVTVQPGTLDFSDVVLGDTSDPLTVTIENTGSADLVLDSLALAGTHPDDFALPPASDQCSGATLAPTDSCTFAVTFSPAAAGARSAQVTIPSNAPSSPDSVSLTGTGTEPAVTVQPGTLDFSDVVLGDTSDPLTVTIENTGSADLVLDSLALAGTHPDDFALPQAADQCSGATLAPTDSCTFTVTFTPAAGGARSAAVMIPSNAPTSPDSVALSGTGTELPELLLMPSAIDFGDQPLGVPSAPETVTIMNIGAGDLVLELLELAGRHPDDYMIVFDGCSGATLQTDASCQIELDFAPLAPGVRRAELTVPSNDPAGPHAVELIGSHDVLFFDGFEVLP